jgi:hypothetical protein
MDTVTDPYGRILGFYTGHMVVREQKMRMPLL